jgi:cytidyltransferase-like protein
MKSIFVSGCYDILHAGHLQFFEEARALGDRLIVSFASKDVLWEHKKRRPSIPDEHKKALLEALWMVDEVVVGSDPDIGLDFKSYFLKAKPDMLVVTEDDQYEDLKKDLCKQVGAEYHVLPKTPPKFKPVSTSELVRYIQAPKKAPLRVDFAGGWLDVPRFAIPGSYIVNCSISPLVSLNDWDYEHQAGLGGSGAWAVINGYTGIQEELDLGVGWQDPAVINETGLCVWRSGNRPELDLKRNGEILNGIMALYWTGKTHDTPKIAEYERPYELIAKAGEKAFKAVTENNLSMLADAVNISYEAQLKEGMEELPEFSGVIAKKYCGGGWGGYALYIFSDPEERNRITKRNDAFKLIEPWIKEWRD